MMFKSIAKAWQKVICFAMPEIKILSDKIDNSGKVLARIDQMLDREKETANREVALYRTTLEGVGGAIPDMLWAKDLDGKYLYANQAIRDGLLFDRRPIGKNDMEISRNAKKRFGPENHTFGEVCGNSDLVVLENEEKQRFLEHGLVKGKMLYLEVYKAPLYANNTLIGVCGTGRDLTEYVETYRAHDCAGCDRMDDIFKKYEFGDK